MKQHSDLHPSPDPSGEAFDRNYYENGIITGKSAYTNYSWLPEMTLPLCHELIEQLEIKRTESILDFGCAKGYMVKAFRLLHREAWGVDISAYAVSQAPTEVKEYLTCIGSLKDIPAHPQGRYDWCIAKDVFEHVPPDLLRECLEHLHALCRKVFIVVPLGCLSEGYFAPDNNLDKTHVICEDLPWWQDLCSQAGWQVTRATYHMPFIKERYESIPKASGFLMLE